MTDSQNIYVFKLLHTPANFDSNALVNVIYLKALSRMEGHGIIIKVKGDSVDDVYEQLLAEINAQATTPLIAQDVVIDYIRTEKYFR